MGYRVPMRSAVVLYMWRKVENLFVWRLCSGCAMSMQAGGNARRHCGTRPDQAGERTSPRTGKDVNMGLTTTEMWFIPRERIYICLPFATFRPVLPPGSPLSKQPYGPPENVKYPANSNGLLLRLWTLAPLRKHLTPSVLAYRPPELPRVSTVSPVIRNTSLTTCTARVLLFGPVFACAGWLSSPILLHGVPAQSPHLQSRSFPNSL